MVRGFRPALALALILFIQVLEVPDIDLKNTLALPSLFHPFGFDSLGRDLFVLTLIALKTSILFSCALTSLQFFLGILSAGILSNLPASAQKRILRLLDLLIVAPDLLIALIWSFYLGPGVIGMSASILMARLASWTRFVYFQFKSQKNDPSFEAGLALGGAPLHLVRVHLFRPVLPILRTQIPYHFFGIILAEASLSYLGLGFPVDGVSLGILFHSATQRLVEAPHLLLGPGLALLLLSAATLKILRYTQRL